MQQKTRFNDETIDNSPFLEVQVTSICWIMKSPFKSESISVRRGLVLILVFVSSFYSSESDPWPPACIKSITMRKLLLSSISHDFVNQSLKNHSNLVKRSAWCSFSKNIVILCQDWLGDPMEKS
jgi:hypothetical protein